MNGNLFDCARRCLDCCDPDEKIALTMQSFIALLAGELSLESGDEPRPFTDAGRPACPKLVPPRELLRVLEARGWM